jgi:glutaminyl-tRNA synthetase
MVVKRRWAVASRRGARYRPPVVTEQVEEEAGNFVREIIADDLKSGRRARIVTRFPPEPNGYLHIGHAKAIWMDFGLARDFGGQCNLRFDDTNPEVEEAEYVDAMKRDVRWLGWDWEDREHYASDYFEQLYTWAEKLIGEGKAYVDTQSLEEIRKQRGSFHEPGVESPGRARSVDENLALFRKMRAGEMAEGSAVLRAKIDMKSEDLKLRDPVMYRIKKVPHHRTGTKWCIYPMYDWAHGQSDAIEGVTHSICSLEYVNHHALYDWFLKAVGIEDPPEQYEFARLALTYTVLSKRRLRELVEEKIVDGWDDPRLPTIAGLRRLGYTPEGINKFCERTGASRRNSVVDVGMLEHAIREDLNARTPRMMAVLDPIKLVIENYPEGEVEHFDCPLHPEDASFGSRKIPFSRELYIDREDFAEVPAKKWFRLAPGQEVRLRYAAIVKCERMIKDETGRVVELRCTWDPSSRGGARTEGPKVKGTIHWVSAAHAKDAEVRLYDRLFSHEDGPDREDWRASINPASKEVRAGVKLEPALADVPAGHRVQFERVGYFISDEKDHAPGRPVFNRTIGLRDSWAKIAARE